MMMNDYQQQSRATAVYPNAGANYIYPTLGLAGETGEVVEKIKKVIRDNNGVMTDAVRAAIAKELGDVMWYIAQLSTELNLELEAIAQGNLDKLRARQEQNMLHGSGDDRKSV